MFNNAEPIKQNFRSRRPLWVTNLLGLILLALIVLAIFGWQQTITRKNLQKNSFARSKMVAGIIEQNIANASASRKTIDTLVSSFLLEKARFIDYLDGVDQFENHELEALALETGLLGISISRADNTAISGPENWLQGERGCEQPLNTVIYNNLKKMGILRYGDKESLRRCVTIGMDATQILQLQEKTSLPVLFDNLASLPGIRYVYLDPSQNQASGKVILQNKDGLVTAESRIYTEHGTLVVGLDASNFIQRRNQLRKQFVVFASLLFSLSLLFSWILFKRQQAELTRTKDLERMLAGERETAALGRATATIAHEVRNPLNAINIGLQRLVMESDNLEQEQLQLIEAMREAVTRTTNIVGELQRYTRRIEPSLEPIDLVEFIKGQLTLFTPQCLELGITLKTEINETEEIYCDRDLTAELLVNLLKNSIEAQEQGGSVFIDLAQTSQAVILKIKNGGFLLDKKEAERIGEAYFTTKTRGSGLGLARCKRIAEAHGWLLHIEPDIGGKTLTIILVIPTRPIQQQA